MSEDIEKSEILEEIMNEEVKIKKERKIKEVEKKSTIETLLPIIEASITIDKFIKKYNLSRVEKYYYKGNFGDSVLRTEKEWKLITGLK
jgi:hypothetical protein